MALELSGLDKPEDIQARLTQVIDNGHSFKAIQKYTLDWLIIFSEAATTIGNQKRGMVLLDNAIASQSSSKNRPLASIAAIAKFNPQLYKLVIRLKRNPNRRRRDYDMAVPRSTHIFRRRITCLMQILCFANCWLYSFSLELKYFFWSF